MKRNYSLYIQTIVLAIALYPLHTQAVNYYVNDLATAGDIYTTSPGGLLNDGLSPATPKTTVNQILANYTLLAGDTVFIDAGTYLEEIHVPGLSGAINSPIVFQGASNDLTVIRSLATGNTTTIWLQNTQYTVWQDFAIEPVYMDNGIDINGNSDFNEVKNIKITGSWYGIDMLTLNFTDIPNSNNIHDNYIESQYVGLRVKAQKQVIGCTWGEAPALGPKFNDFHHNTIINVGDNQSSFATVELHAIEDNQLYGNKLIMEAGIDAAGVIFLAHSVSGNILMNNYLLNYSNVGTDNYGVFIDDNLDYSMSFIHNSIYTRKACFFGRIAANGFIFSNNILSSVNEACIDLNNRDIKFGECLNNYYHFPSGTLAQTTTTITSIAQWQVYNPDTLNSEIYAKGGSTPEFDPLFVDREVCNLDLHCGSPANDAAFTTFPEVTEDLHYTARPIGIREDIGAFEGALIRAGDMNPDITRVCTGTELIFTISDRVGGTAQWQSSTDGTNWNNDISPLTQINDTLAQGTFTNNTSQLTTLYFRMMLTGPCQTEYTDTVDVTIEPLPDFGLDLLPDTICPQTQIDLSLTNQIGDSITWYSSPQLNGPFTQIGLGNPIQDTPSSSTHYMADIKWNNGVCPKDTSNTKSVEVLSTPNAPVLSPASQSHCTGESATVQAQGTETLSFTWEQSSDQINWTVINGISDEATVPLTNNSSFVDTTWIRIIYTAACGSAFTNTVEILTGPQATPGITTNTSLCLGDNYSISITGGSGDNVFLQTSNQSGGPYVDETDNPIQGLLNEDLFYRSGHSYSDGICPISYSDEGSILPNGNPLFISLSVPPSVCIDDPVTLEIDSSFNVDLSNITWSIDGVVQTETGQALFIEEAINNTTITASALSSVSCSEPSTSSAPVQVTTRNCNCDIFIPTAISPNNDPNEVNETWMITGLDCWESHLVKVFNRYGSLVHQSANYKDWDGKRNGTLLPVATYYYVVQVSNSEGGTERFSGPLTIMY